MIFVDTGAFLARYVERDQFHAKARRSWEKLRTSGRRCVTSNFVLDETLTLLARRAGYAFSAERARAVYDSSSLEILRPGHEEELAAVEEFGRFADQAVSFTDCVSFVLMRRQGIADAFAYDRHFELAGFSIWR